MGNNLLLCLMKEKVLQNIKTIRESKNLTENFIAEKLRIKQSTYCKKETGGIEFTLSELICLSDVLQVSLVRLIDLDIAKIINQQNHDSSTGIIENQFANSDNAYILCIEQHKEENNFLKNQIKILIDKIGKS